MMLFFVFKNQKIMENMVTTLLNCKVCFSMVPAPNPLIPLFVNRELAVRQCLPRNNKKTTTFYLNETSSIFANEEKDPGHFFC